jgi:hypothetical protein
MQASIGKMAVGFFAAWLLVLPVLGQTAIVVDFPDPAAFYQNTTFAIDGDVAYVPSFDDDVLWSFSLVTGELLDPDGLALPAPGTASDPFLFAGDRLAIPGWFPSQGILVADVSDPTNLTQVGIIAFPSTTNIQGQNVEVDDDGVIGYVAGFPDDTLYSFNINTLSLEDPDGLALPANPDRIARAGDRVAIVDTTNGRIMVADVSDPANLALAGVITLPGSNTFGSNDNIVFAEGTSIGFVTNNECILYSFDVDTLSLLDPDGLFVGGSQLFGADVAIHGDTVACLYSRGLTFADVSDPSNLVRAADANFGGTIAPQGSATVDFTADGSKAAVPVIYPANLVYTFEVATGDQVSAPFPVDAQPNYLTVYGPGDRLATLISGSDGKVWLISDLFGAVVGDVDGDGDVDLNDLAALLAAYGACSGDPDYNPDADFDDSGCIDLNDLAALLSNYGYGA